MIIAIIQARSRSTRLPEKVLMEIYGKSLLELYVDRVRKSQTVDKIVVATTIEPYDDKIAEICKKIGVDCFRGSENDLVDRYYQCAVKYQANVVVRVTSDDPFVDYQVIDRGVSILLEQKVDFVTNHFEPTYPEGLDVEIYSFQVLENVWKQSVLPYEREHVFPYIQEHQKDYKIINFTQKEDYSGYRWTIDHQCDFDMAEKVYSYLYMGGKKIFLQREILKLLSEHPEISLINSHIQRKEGVSKSINDYHLSK